jgi:F0F1-type ATP synthase membrane subunit b/b'
MLELPPDVGFYIQIVLFFVFAALLKVLVLDPTAELLAERGRRTTGAQADAVRTREEVDAMRLRFEKALDEARHAGQAAGEDLRRQSAAQEHEILDGARRDAARTLEQMRERVAAEAEIARARLREEADALARQAAEKILGRAVAS